MFFGLYVEKGLAPKVRAAYSSSKGRRLIMGDAWCWFEMLPGLTNGALAASVKDVINQYPTLPLRLQIDASVVNDPGSYDPYESQDPGDIIAWKLEPDGLRLIHEPQRMLSSLAKTTGLADLAQILVSEPEMDWYWLDLTVGITLQNQLRPSDDMETWYAMHIWNRVLEHFTPWLK